MADLIDLTQARAFLDTLAHNGRFTFFILHDKEKTRPRHPHGSFNRHRQRLARDNSGGNGIFVAVNQTDLQGRCKENITHVRAFWADLDRKLAKGAFTVDDAKAALIHCPPSIIVETPGGFHLYWLLAEPVPCDEDGRNEAERLLRRIQHALERFGADANVTRVNQVLRIPGYFHNKHEPTLVKFLEVTPHRYTSEAIAAAFPDIEADRPKRNDIEAPRPRTPYPTDGEMIEGACRYAAKLSPSIEGQNGSRDLFNAALKLQDKFALSELETLDVLVSAFNPRCEPVWSDGELRRAIHRAAKVVGGP